MKKLLLITALSGLLLSFQTMAAGEHRKGRASEHSKADKAERNGKKIEKKLEKIDTSGDGKVDLTEYLASSEKRFHSTDINSDGYITAEEMKEWSRNARAEIRQASKEAKEAARNK